MNKKLITFLTLLLFVFIPKVNAASASINSSNSVENGKNISIKINISGSNIESAKVDFSFDTTSFDYVSSSGVVGLFSCNPLQQNSSSIKITCTYTGMEDGVNGSQNVATVNLKAKKVGTGTVSISGIEINDDNASGSSKEITITEPQVVQPTTPDPSPSPSTPSNNESKPSTPTTPSNNTNQNKNIDTKKDTKNDEKTKKDGSSDNKLASLSVEGQDITPSFNANTTNYSLKVSYDVESIKVNAKANDTKAKVTIKGDSGLKVGKNNVSVIVEAENGDKKTYTIEVEKEADPNKTYNTNNYLSNIKPSIGILSRVFDKEKENYVLYLPYEVDKITFETPLEDSSATLDVEGSDTLNVGENTYLFKVRAENGNIKTYKVVVKRANIYDMGSSNTYLKFIKINNGKLLSNFDKEIKVYNYNKNKDFSVEVEAEDENSKVSTLQDGEDIYFVVEAPNGDYSVYVLHLSKGISLKYIIIGVCSLVFVGIFTFMIIYKKKKRKKLLI